MSLPKMLRIRQHFERRVISDVARQTQEQLEKLDLQKQVQPGQSVAITVGSRGIANIAIIARAAVDHFHGLGARPFIVPAMGSHGGATAEGQRSVLAGFGVTAESMGCEIRSSMETVVVATTPQGIPVYFDRNAFEADHVVVMGRIKPHTMFVGDIESGLHKMMLIGLGKHAGALTYHRAIKNFTFDTIIRTVADAVLARCHVLAGVAIVENAYDETALIEAVLPHDFQERERQLLKQAAEWMPRLPFRNVDLLIVDRIGKNISGAGMDTNIIGRKFNDHASTPADNADCKRILVRSLTPQTKGNACGIGIAEFTTQRAVDQIDREYTRINCVTSGHPTAGMIPLVYPNDRAAIEDALLTIGLIEPVDARVLQIADTLHLSEALASEACLRDGVPAGLEVLSSPENMQFDSEGMLDDVFPAVGASQASH
jgi:hypothetical protein